jgi:two-component system response regulator YesN
MIDWAGLGMKVVGEARNGKAALEMYQKRRPNLILTDIKMPVMDGLEMIAEVRKSDKNAKIIILTCHQEFDLLRQAMRLGVTDYILKNSMSMEEMQAVIEKARDELVTENRGSKNRGTSFFDISLAKEDALKNYLVYETCSDAAFEKLVKRLDMRIEPTDLVLCLMRIDNGGTGARNPDRKAEAAVRDIVGSLVRDLLESMGSGEIVNEGGGRYFLLLTSGDNARRSARAASLSDVLGRISQIMKTYADSTVTFGISSVGRRYSDLKRLYVEALSALEQGYYVRGARHLKSGDEQSRRIFHQTIEKFRGSVQHLTRLDEAYRAEIISGIDRLDGMFGRPAAEAVELLTRLISWPAATLRGEGSDVLNLALDCSERVHACSTIDEAIETYLQYVHVILERHAESRVVSREVAEAVKYIHVNFEKTITLSEVAEHVEMSPNYLSSLFKRELKLSFTGYLNQVRIDKAGELLKSTHLKSYAIAEKVGFADESYFSRIFKRIKGIRPSEYKKMRV